jgi:hypothetical protein
VLKEFFAKRKLASDEAGRERGYNYAAGQLLKSGENVTYMYFKLDNECSNVFDRTAFDKGMREALNDYNAHFLKSLSL